MYKRQVLNGEILSFITYYEVVQGLLFLSPVTSGCQATEDTRITTLLIQAVSLSLDIRVSCELKFSINSQTLSIKFSIISHLQTLDQLVPYISG